MMRYNMYRRDKPILKHRIDWARIASLFFPYWRQQSLVIICIILVSVFGLTRGFVTANIIDVVVPKKNLQLLFLDITLLLASQVVSSAIGILQSYLNTVVGNGIMRDIR